MRLDPDLRQIALSLSWIFCACVGLNVAADSLSETGLPLQESQLDSTLEGKLEGLERTPDSRRIRRIKRPSKSEHLKEKVRSEKRGQDFFLQHSPILWARLPAAIVSTANIPPDVGAIDLVAPAGVALKLFKRLTENSSFGILFEPQLYFYWPVGLPLIGLDGGFRIWTSEHNKLEIMGAIHFQSTRNSGPLVDSQLDTDWYSVFCNFDLLGDTLDFGFTARVIALRTNTVSVSEGLPTQIRFGFIPVASIRAKWKWVEGIQVLASADYVRVPKTGVASNSFALALPAQDFFRISAGVGFDVFGGDLEIKFHRVEGVQDRRALFYQFPLVTQFYSLSTNTISGEIAWKL